MCKITVVVPVYNAGLCLERCVSSVLAQDFTDYELLLVNDGSTDNSAEIMRSLADADSRIQCISKENGGAASARNAGIDKASGKYICFVDCDDYIDSGMLSFMYAAAERDSADIVMCGYLMENGKSRSPVRPPEVLLNSDNINRFIPEIKSKNLIDSPCNKLYGTDFLRSSGIRMPEHESYEDTDFNLRLLKLKPVISCHPDCFYHYVLHMGSATRHYDKTKLEIIKKRARLLKEVTSGVDSYCDFYYIKSVFSSIIDMFLSLKRNEIKKTIRTELSDNEFITAAGNAEFSGRSARIIINTAKSGGVTRVFLFLYASYILKYRLQGLFLKVKG